MRSIKLGRIGTGAARAFGPLIIEFLVDCGRRGPVTAMRVAMRPGDAHLPLLHARTAEFFLVLRGDMRAWIGGRQRLFRKGDYAFLPPGTLHEFRAGKRGIEVISIFTPALDMRKPDILYQGRR